MGDEYEIPERSRWTICRRGEGPRKRRKKNEDEQQVGDGAGGNENPEDEEDEAAVEDPEEAQSVGSDFPEAGCSQASAVSAESINSVSGHHGEGTEYTAQSDSDWSMELNDLQNVDFEYREEGDEHDDGDEDADDPHFEFSSEDENTETDSEDEQAGNLNFDHEALQLPLGFSSARTGKDALVLDLALMVRHHWTYESLMQGFQVKNTLLGAKLFPTSKKELWRTLGRNEAGISVHVYCDCGNYLGKKKSLAEEVRCKCLQVVRVSKAKSFFVLSLRKQFEHFLSTPGIHEILSYRHRRKKQDEDGIEDIFDGEGYKKLLKEGLGENDFSYVLNTDGCKIKKNARTSIYPIFLRLNELPPNLRQKFIFLAGLYVGVGDPNMVSFLKPVVDELNDLNEVGVTWSPDGTQRVTSRFYPTCSCVDGKARWQTLNMNSHSGYYACTLCTIKGVKPTTTMRFPIKPHPQIPPYENRTDAAMKASMLAATPTIPIFGHKGVTPLMNLRYFNLFYGQGFDDLHNWFECLAAVLTDLTIRFVPKLRNLSVEGFMDVIDSRMSKIKTPSKISRKPGTCSIKKRGSWTGTEWRNWLVYYSVPCLEGLISSDYLKLFEIISHAVFLLSKESVRREEVALAKELIQDFLNLFEEKFGLECTRLNLHSSVHAGDSVLEWGPVWCYSTFNFESWNHRLLLNIKSPNGAGLQIITRHLLLIHLHLAQFSNTLPNDIQDQLSRILNSSRLVRMKKVKEEMYVRQSENCVCPTEQESNVLQLEGLRTDNMTIHKKMLIKGVEYSSSEDAKVDTKSDNTMVFTSQNTFCTIKRIVTFKNELDGGSEVCGMFVDEYNVERRHFRFAHHIVALSPGANIHFIVADMVKVPCVKVTVLGTTFSVPMPNLNEID